MPPAKPLLSRLSPVGANLVAGLALTLLLAMAPRQAAAETFPRSLPGACTMELVAAVYGFNEDTFQTPA